MKMSNVKNQTEVLARLNYNELPFSPTDVVVRAAQKYCSDTNRYPEVDSRTLRQALADHHDVPLDWVATGAGTAVVIHQIMIASGQGDIAFAWPSFDAFPPMAAGLRMQAHLTATTADGACDLGELLRAITPQTTMVIVCTPNSPTGGIVRHDELVEFLQAVPSHVTVLIDEAYYEFAQDSDVPRSLELVRQYPNVVMSRTFSKAYGLAGFRVGYAIAQPSLAERIRQAGVPFAIPVPAQMAALEVLQHPADTQRRVATILRERARLAEVLRAQGAPVVVGHGNFVWLPLGKDTSKIGDDLLRRGVAVKIYDGLGLRVTVGTSHENDMFIAAWNISIAATISR